MQNTLMYDYGGWISSHAKTAPTGVSLTAVRVISWAAAASAALANIGTGGQLLHSSLSQSPALHVAPLADAISISSIRTPSENLQRIRDVLKPAISDLATAFGVSRQAVYNWLNGETIADANAAKLQDLADAAEILANAGVPASSTLMKRKFADGLTLMQVVQAGKSAQDAARLLVGIYQREAAERDRLNARFAHRTKTAASADFDFAAGNDPA